MKKLGSFRQFYVEAAGAVGFSFWFSNILRIVSETEQFNLSFSFNICLYASKVIYTGIEPVPSSKALTL